ncbi:hypothetical protein WAI453_000603 [Rhynchosporium graminicola]
MDPEFQSNEPVKPQVQPDLPSFSAVQVQTRREAWTGTICPPLGASEDSFPALVESEARLPFLFRALQSSYHSFIHFAETTAPGPPKMCSEDQRQLVRFQHSPNMDGWMDYQPEWITC